MIEEQHFYIKCFNLLSLRICTEYYLSVSLFHTQTEHHLCIKHILCSAGDGIVCVMYYIASVTVRYLRLVQLNMRKYVDDLKLFQRLKL